jgi:hypothetical protein
LFVFTTDIGIKLNVSEIIIGIIDLQEFMKKIIRQSLGAMLFFRELIFDFIYFIC